MAGFRPFERMEERVERDRNSSDAEYFDALMLYGEFVTKLVVGGLVAAIGDDPDRARYSAVHRLVRASGIGDWARTVDEVLTGPAAQFVVPGGRAEMHALTKKCGPHEWQYDAVSELHEAARGVLEDVEKVGAKTSLKTWFHLFARLRNKTRGHGATLAGSKSSAAGPLRDSIELITANYPLFGRSWAFLYRNLSGKYRVSYVGVASDTFEPLKREKTVSLPNGLYVDFDGPRRVELIHTDTDLSDFFAANGDFAGAKGFELLSYITGETMKGDGAAYLRPATELPPAKTEGLGALAAQGETFGNLPDAPDGYVGRPELESRLLDALANERHPIVTLHGPGGIGKTSLALKVLHGINQSARYSVIVWFSARDIELLADGPKPVRPHVLNEKDVAREYVGLLAPGESNVDGFKPVEFFARELGKAGVGPTLFAFDNFETVSMPEELYTWLDTYIRPPNKVLITTRFRAFNGDYQIPVRGMTETESRELIDSTAHALGVFKLLTEEYRSDLHAESDGHPYVMKVLLGEVAKAGALTKIERIVGDSERMLTALFERSYSRLSPAARRVFLTLCGWRSMVPLTGLKAVLLRAANERMDVAAAVRELERSAMVVVKASQADRQEFIEVPLVASLFGRRKLSADALRNVVEADVQLLHAFGAAQESDLRHGLAPRIARLFSSVAARIAGNRKELEELAPILEFVAGSYAPAWLNLSELLEPYDPKRAAEALRHFLESCTGPERKRAWERMATLAQAANDEKGELQAWSEFAEDKAASLDDVSFAANRVNSILRAGNPDFDKEEKAILVSRVIKALQDRMDELDGTDISRLAWLYLNIQNADKAKHYTQLGLERAPDNHHLKNLSERLSR